MASVDMRKVAQTESEEDRRQRDESVDDGRGWIDRRGSAALVSGGLLVGITAVAQFAIPALGVESYILPTPSSVVGSLANDFISPAFWRDTLTTLTEMGIGWVAGCAAGILLGIVINEFRILEVALTPYIVALNSVPKVAIAPVLVIAFGFGMASKVVITAIMAFFPVLVNMRVGLSGADPLQLEMMHGLKASRWKTLLWVKLPGALPALFAGIQLAVVLGIIGAIVGEFTGASAGLGYIILQRTFSMDQSGVFSALVTLSLIGITLDLAVRWLQRRVVTW